LPIVNINYYGKIFRWRVSTLTSNHRC